MIWAIAVDAIVAIIGFTEVQKAKHRARHGITTDVMGNEKPILPDEVKREVEELRERVKVLEVRDFAEVRGSAPLAQRLYVDRSPPPVPRPERPPTGPGSRPGPARSRPRRRTPPAAADALSVGTGSPV